MDDTIRVLVTDDERPIREGCHRVLTGKGYAVLLAENGQMALEVLEKEQVDILLLDLKMPVLGGEEVLEIVRTRYPQLPVIIITGHGDIDMAVSAIKAGAFDFIEKPIDDRRLVTSIGEAVRRSRDKMATERELVDLQKRYAELSERQRQVMDFAIQGLSNKEIAARLGISPRTVEHYRESAMERMQASRLAELVYMAVRLRRYATTANRDE